MAGVSLVSTSLVVASIEAFLYGIFLLLFGLSFYLLRRRLRAVNPHMPTWKVFVGHPMMLAGWIIWITVTTHWVLIVHRSFMAFIHFKNGTAPLEFYGNLARTSEVLKIASLISALLYHWIIWERSIYAIAFPLASYSGLIVCGIATIYEFSQFTLGESAFDSAAGRWITGSCITSLCTNLSACALIAYKLLKARMQSRSHGGTDMLKIVAILVESAALYVGWTVFYMITYLAQSNLEDAIFDSWSPIAGIGFMLINVRVGAGWSIDTERGRFASHRPSRNVASPIAVSVTRVVDRDLDPSNRSKFNPDSYHHDGHSIDQVVAPVRAV